MLSSALPSASPMSFHQRCICDSYRLHRLIWMTSAHTMIRKSTANCTRTVTTSSCASTTTESKKCRGCNKSFKTMGSTTPEFVIAHRELYAYGRINGSKRLLMTERDFFYHCDSVCIRPRHPYFVMCDIVVSQHHQLSEGDVKHLNTLETFP